MFADVLYGMLALSISQANPEIMKFQILAF
jgi:hypothetical protein